jgi:hypothetical protein
MQGHSAKIGSIRLGSLFLSGRRAGLPASMSTLPLARRCAASFNDPVGLSEERRCDRDPERLGGLQIDHELEIGRVLDR